MRKSSRKSIATYALALVSVNVHTFRADTNTDNGVSLPSVVLRSRTDKFEQKYSLCADLVNALV